MIHKLFYFSTTILNEIPVLKSCRGKIKIINILASNSFYLLKYSLSQKQFYFRSLLFLKPLFIGSMPI